MNLRDKLEDNIAIRDAKKRAKQQKELDARNARLAKERQAKKEFMDQAKLDITRMIQAGEVPEYLVRSGHLASWIMLCVEMMVTAEDQDIWEAAVAYFEVQGIRLHYIKKRSFWGDKETLYLTVTPLDKAT